MLSLQRWRDDAWPSSGQRTDFRSTSGEPKAAYPGTYLASHSAQRAAGQGSAHGPLALASMQLPHRITLCTALCSPSASRARDTAISEPGMQQPYRGSDQIHSCPHVRGGAARLGSAASAPPANNCVRSAEFSPRCLRMIRCAADIGRWPRRRHISSYQQHSECIPGHNNYKVSTRTTCGRPSLPP